MPEHPSDFEGYPPRTVYGIYGEGPVTLRERLWFWGIVIVVFGGSVALLWSERLL